MWKDGVCSVEWCENANHTNAKQVAVSEEGESENDHQEGFIKALAHTGPRCGQWLIIRCLYSSITCRERTTPNYRQDGGRVVTKHCPGKALQVAFGKNVFSPTLGKGSN